MRYYISDLHFSHAAMNFRMDERGFASVEEMNEYLIKQWNKKVNRNDEVVILGDLSFARADETTEIIKRLKGKKILIVGNHEKYLKDPSFDRRLFWSIEHYLELNDDNRKVILCHYPVFCYNGQNRLDANGNPRVFMLHGHIHNTFDQQLVDEFVALTKSHKREIGGREVSIPCEMINCFCMYSDYIPLTLDEWIEVNKKRLKESKK